MGLFNKEKKEKESQYLLSATKSRVLDYRVYVMSFFIKILVSIALIVIGGLVGLIFYGGLFKNNGKYTLFTYVSNLIIFLLIGLIARKIFLPVVINVLKNRRIKMLKLQFRDFLYSLSNSLSSGMNVNDSLINSYNDLKIQYSEDAYIVKEVREMINGINNNISIEDMLKDFGNRSSVDDISNFATVFETAYRTGGNIKDIVRRTAEIIGEKMLIAEEIQTKITSNKLQMQVMNVIPIFIILMLRFLSSEFADAFASFIGVICMTIGIILFVIAYVVGQKIMDIKG